MFKVIFLPVDVVPNPPRITLGRDLNMKKYNNIFKYCIFLVYSINLEIFKAKLRKIIWFKQVQTKTGSDPLKKVDPDLGLPIQKSGSSSSIRPLMPDRPDTEMFIRSDT